LGVFQRFQRLLKISASKAAGSWNNGEIFEDL
jgi:hypothetical protein